MFLPEDLIQGAPAGQPEPQPAGPSAGAGEQTGQPGEKYITLSEAQGLIEAAEKRQRQSLKDSVSSRVIKEVERLKSAGIQATEEQVAALVASGPEGSDAGAQSTDLQPASGTVPAQGQPGSETLSPLHEGVNPTEAQAVTWMKEDGSDMNNPVLREIYLMQAKRGIRLMEEDPETKKIQYGSLSETLNSIQTAIDEKAERIGKSGTPARVPALAGSGAAPKPDYSKKSSTEIFEDYYQKG